jgi:hypothetical protein
VSYPLDSASLYPLPTNLGNDTVTVLKRSVGGLDRLGVQQLVSTPTVITGCSLQPNSGDEVISDTDLTIAMWILFTPVVPIIQTLTSADAIQVTVDDTPVVYEDFGDPVLWTELDGMPEHYRIKLRKARG